MRARWTILLIAIGVASPIIWHKQIQYRISPKNFGVVVPETLYRGADQHPNVLRDICEDNHIRTVIDLSGADPGEDEVCRALGIDRFNFSLPGDGRGDPVTWAAVLKLLSEPERQPVFVHCAAGAQRTTTAVMLYRRFLEGESFQESYPESFDFRHKPDEWELVAFLADNAPAIEAMWRAGAAEIDGKHVDLDQLVQQAWSAKSGAPIGATREPGAGKAGGDETGAGDAGSGTTETVRAGTHDAGTDD